MSMFGIVYLYKLDTMNLYSYKYKLKNKFKKFKISSKTNNIQQIFIF